MHTYSIVRDQNQETLRRTVVAAAEQVLLEHGAEAVTVRRIAQQLDCSTTVIYNLFGSKDGLANALYRQGCHLLHFTLAAVARQAEHRRYLTDLAWAYWTFAHQNPQFYAVMFAGAFPQFKPDPASIEEVATAIGLLVGVLNTYREAGVLRSEDTVQAAKMLWAALHGVIHLRFAGHFDDAEAKLLYDRTIATLLDSILEG